MVDQSVWEINRIYLKKIIIKVLLSSYTTMLKSPQLNNMADIIINLSTKFLSLHIRTGMGINAEIAISSNFTN